MDIIGTAAAHFGHWHWSTAWADANLLRAGHQRHHKGFVILAEGEVVAVGRYFICGGQLSGRMRAFCFAAQVGTNKLPLVLACFGHEQTVVSAAKVRIGDAGCNPDRRTARGCDPIHSRLVRHARRRQIAALAPFEHDHRAVGGKTRACIMSRLLRDRAASAAG